MSRAPVLFADHPRQLDLGHRQFRLTRPYRYQWTHEEEARRLTVPRGFVHDGASVPRIVWSFVPPQPKDRAAVFHDLLYQHGGELPEGCHERYVDRRWIPVEGAWSRRDADRLFCRMLREDPAGPGRIRRRLAFRAVQLFGRGSWRDAG